MDFDRGLWHCGSSPRVRGKQRDRGQGVRAEGLIPACAGKTLDVLGAVLYWRAHPRVCGENIEAGDKASQDEGSSPRVRGKPFYNLYNFHG